MRIVWNKDNKESNNDDGLTPEQEKEQRQYCRKNYLRDHETFYFLAKIHPEFEEERLILERYNKLIRNSIEGKITDKYFDKRERYFKKLLKKFNS